MIKNKSKTGIRLGITVSKKVGCAVVRNRIKRLIRESYRQNEDRLSGGVDIVVVARKRAADANYKDIFAALEYLFSKLSLLNTENE